LYTERVHWDWPWIRTTFTAGMRRPISPP
jgi:hypothetical protein